MPSQAEKNVFGAEAEEHPVTGMVIEKGKGALNHDRQAELHCDFIEQAHGKDVADEMRAKLKAHIEERDAPAPKGNITDQHIAAVAKAEGKEAAEQHKSEA